MNSSFYIYYMPEEKAMSLPSFLENRDITIFSHAREFFLTLFHRIAGRVAYISFLVKPTKGRSEQTYSSLLYHSVTSVLSHFTSFSYSSTAHALVKSEYFIVARKIGNNGGLSVTLPIFQEKSKRLNKGHRPGCKISRS